MVARMSPIYEFSSTALSVVLVVGATTALFTGLLAWVEFDIKRIIAFSTMSQLGYMMVGDGASAYSAGIFHLMTHASFKALLFLSAGSVILALHHEQDLRKMGNLKKYLPLTYGVFLIGALALSAIPPFSGFYSKDPIIEAVSYSTLPGSRYAYVCLLLGAFVTAYYIFRLFFMAFHTEERMDVALRSHIKESSWSIRIPLIVLAVPSALLGIALVNAMIFKIPNLLGASVTVASSHKGLASFIHEYRNAFTLTLHSVFSLPFWLSIAGISMAWLNVCVMPKVPMFLEQRFPLLHRILVKRYGFDAFNEWVFVRGALALSEFFYRVGDLKLIDHFMVEGVGRNTTRLSRFMRRLQSGYLYHYVFVMILGVLVFLIWLVLL